MSSIDPRSRPVAGAGKPNVASLNSLAIPAYIAKGSTLKDSAALGASTGSAEGFGPPPPPKPKTAEPKEQPDEQQPRPRRQSRQST